MAKKSDSTGMIIGIIIFIVLALLIRNYFMGAVIETPEGQFRFWTHCYGCAEFGCQPLSMIIDGNEYKLDGVGGGIIKLYRNDIFICDQVNYGWSDDNCNIKCAGSDQPEICKYYSGGLTDEENTFKLYQGAGQVNCDDGAFCPGGALMRYKMRDIKFEFTDNAFDYNVTAEIVGNAIRLNILLENNIMPIQGQPGVRIKFPSPLGGWIEDEITEDLILVQKGQTTLEYEFELVEEIDELIITPTFIIYLTPELFDAEFTPLYFAPDTDNDGRYEWDTMPFIWGGGGACKVLKDQGNLWTVKPLMYYGEAVGDEVHLYFEENGGYVPSECVEYLNQIDCENNNCYWYNFICHDDPEPELECSDYFYETICEDNSCYWYDSICNDEPQPSWLCTDFENQADCEDNDCYWWSDNVCHSTQESGEPSPPSPPNGGAPPSGPPEVPEEAEGFFEKDLMFGLKFWQLGIIIAVLLMGFYALMNTGGKR